VLVLQESLVFQATQAVLVYLVPQVCRENLDYLDYQATQVPLELLVYKDQQARVVLTLSHRKVI
jgi:hypothetical protein